MFKEASTIADLHGGTTSLHPIKYMDCTHREIKKSEHFYRLNLENIK